MSDNSMKAEIRCSVVDLEVGYHRALLFEHGQQFYRVFGVSLTRFLNPYTGFDVVAFDEFLKTPDGESLSEFLLRKFGVGDEGLIRKLLGMR